MAPTEGRFAMPERWWDCRCSTPWYIHITQQISNTNYDYQ